MERVTIEQLNGLCRQVERIYRRLKSAVEAMDQNACESIAVEAYPQALQCADYLLTFSARCYMSTVIGWGEQSKPE